MVRFGIQLPIQSQSTYFAEPWEAGAGAKELASVARVCDEHGFDYVAVCDHIAIPRERAEAMRTTWYDTVATLSWLAGITERVRLLSHVFVPAYRHPLATAKAFSTLDSLSGGRAVLGVGAGHVEAEFDALGIPFAERAARTSESVRAMRSLWKPEPEAFQGKFFRWPALESNPKPVQQPGVPIVVGGHTEMAARRAARYGDGFFPGVGEPAKLTALLAVLRDECKRIGRRPEEIEITAGRTPDLDSVRALRDLGVSRIMMAPPAFDPEGITKGLHDLADRLISKI